MQTKKTKNKMKKLLVVLALLPLSLFAQTDFTVTVVNKSAIQEIGGRKVEFGVQEKVEEMLVSQGWILRDKSVQSSDSGTNKPSTEFTVAIEKIESPQKMLNIMGTKWLKKDYLVTTSISWGGHQHSCVGKRSNLLFAAFLEVENSEIPLNKKSFSKSLEESLSKCVGFTAHK